jgi:hypothetical protein
VYPIKVADLQKGEWTAEWLPEFTHPSLPEAQSLAARKPAMVAWALAIHLGTTDITPVWNDLLPDLQLETLEQYLQECWDSRFSHGDKA